MDAKLPLVIENLSFRYRRREDLALRDISLQVEPGQVILIAGASGCGKTTLARGINGLIPRSYKGELTGKVLLYGKEMSDQPLSRVSQVVGTVLQDPERQILGIKVLNEVAFGLENLGKPRSEILESVDESLNHLGIGHLRDRETFLLSGGEKQKVALAGVLAMKPGILLLDEPLASLDPASSLDALSLIRRLADEGMTVLLVEHRVEDVLRIHPDRVLFMKEGEIHYQGPPEDLDENVDYHEVKLPAPLIIERAAREPARSYPLQSLLSAGGGGAEPGQVKTREPLVEFKKVNFSYDENVPVLEDINLQIHTGDIIAVLGANGAGKTTLVKHAIGLLKPRSGDVLVNGRSTHEMSVAEIADTLGYVFQSPSHMLFAPTVREELAFGPKNLGHTAEEIEKEVSESIHIVNLSGLEKEPPLALSFGQQKRVSIAAILSMRSKILVMDEPTAGQDYMNYISFMDSIVQLPGFQAVLFITHDIDVAVIYANRVLLVHDGKIAADGEPFDVLKDRNLLETCRVVPTSLLKANLERYPETGRFMRAEELAHVVPA
jgi:energy-coupling factor transporter ATP-binding protein EcfA2